MNETAGDEIRSDWHPKIATAALAGLGYALLAFFVFLAVYIAPWFVANLAKPGYDFSPPARGFLNLAAIADRFWALLLLLPPVIAAGLIHCKRPRITQTGAILFAALSLICVIGLVVTITIPVILAHSRP